MQNNSTANSLAVLVTRLEYFGMPLRIIFFRYLTLKNVLTMKSSLGITHPANLCTNQHDRWNIQTQCYLFAADSLGLSYIRIIACTQSAPEEAGWGTLCVTYGRSKSFKVIEIGTNRGSPYANYYYIPLLWRYAYLLSFPRCNDLLIENLYFCRFYSP